MDARKKYEQQSVSLRSLAVFDSDCFLAAVKATMSDKGDKCFPEFDELLCHLDQLPVDKLDKFDEALGPPFFPYGCSKQQYYAETRRVLADTWYAKRAQANREMWEQHMDRIPPLALVDMIMELTPKDLPRGFATAVDTCFHQQGASLSTKDEATKDKVTKDKATKDETTVVYSVVAPIASASTASTTSFKVADVKTKGKTVVYSEGVEEDDDDDDDVCHCEDCEEDREFNPVPVVKKVPFKSMRETLREEEEERKAKKMLRDDKKMLRGTKKEGETKEEGKTLNRLSWYAAIARGNLESAEEDMSETIKEWKCANKEAIKYIRKDKILPRDVILRRTKAYSAMKKAGKALRLAKKDKKRAVKRLKKKEGEQK